MFAWLLELNFKTATFAVIAYMWYEDNALDYMEYILLSQYAWSKQKS